MLCSVFSCVDSANPQTVAHQAPLSMGFSKQEYWGGLPFSTPGHLPDPGVKPASLASPALIGRFFTTVLPVKPLLEYCLACKYLTTCKQLPS